MIYRVTAATSVDVISGNAFALLAVQDTLIVDAGAYLITEAPAGVGALLTGPWTATINGEVESAFLIWFLSPSEWILGHYQHHHRFDR